MNIEKQMRKLDLFWQYPVITEKEFYNQNKNNGDYFPFPWATIIDKKFDEKRIFYTLKNYIQDKNYYTCCQHIHFRRLKNLFEKLNIRTLYTSHKIINEDYLGKIKLISCPLYAVNIEDEGRNEIFKKSNYLDKEREYLYSFMGGYQKQYLSDIRKQIFKLKKIKENFILDTGDWHFNSIVYDKKQNIKGTLNEKQDHKEKTKYYNKILLESKYTLCPSGSGPNSIRFWEALACGSIPILLSDTLELPEHELWGESIIKLKESEINNLELLLKEIDECEERKRRENCLKLYNYFRNNYRNIIKI